MEKGEEGIREREREREKRRAMMAKVRVLELNHDGWKPYLLL